MKIFVLHYSKLTHRKNHIIHELKNHGIHDFEFIENFDKDEITDDQCPEFHRNYIENKRSELSLHLKHFYVYRLMMTENIEEALIFEDDVILSDGFMKKLTEYTTQLPSDYDMLFIGDGCRLHIPEDRLVPNQYVYEKSVEVTSYGAGATRCTDSYIIHNRCATKLCNYISTLTNTIDAPIDYWLNDAAMNTKLKVYWGEPTIVTQGSQSGMFSRSIEDPIKKEVEPIKTATNHIPDVANNLFALDGRMNQHRQ